jgi:hypothetical protein
MNAADGVSGTRFTLAENSVKVFRGVFHDREGFVTL